MDFRLFLSSQHLKAPSQNRETDINGSPGRPFSGGALEGLKLNFASHEKASRSPFRRHRSIKKDPPPPPPPKPQFVQSEQARIYQHQNAPLAIPRYPPPPPAAGAVAWSTSPRPLSDIKEITEPNLPDLAARQINSELDRRGPGQDANRLSPRPVHDRSASQNSRQQTPKALIDSSRSKHESPAKAHIASDVANVFGIPSENVPYRSSSRGSAKSRDKSHARKPSLRQPRPSLEENVQQAKRVDFKTPPKQHLPRSRSLVSKPPRQRQTTGSTSYAIEDILDFPSYRHPKIKLELQLGAPLFVGGGSIEGNVRIIPHDLERKRARSGQLESLFVDLIGVEELSGAKRSIFISLSHELERLDQNPYTSLIKPESPYPLPASNYSIPFSISLPLDVGPPPFTSKNARIRYVLAATLWLRDVERPTSVRCSQEIPVISVYDPEKALMSLPSPLTASDTFSMRHASGLETVKVTAGLHRQVWVSGTSVFVDITIDNDSRKPVKKLELQLERDILRYKHAAASTFEKSAGQARIFDSNEQLIVIKKVFKHGVAGWNDFAAFSVHTRTCDLDLPKGHATVRCGKYFEARFFLNIIASFSYTKTVAVQLPIVLIHMNSLDVVPNSVARVAAAIEEKKASREPGAFDEYQEWHLGSIQNPERDKENIRSEEPRRARSVQGRAFAAPRTQSLERMRSKKDEWEELGRELERSPRKRAPYLQRHLGNTSNPATSSPRREQRPPIGHATVVQLGPDNAEIILARTRRSTESTRQPPNPSNKGLSGRRKGQPRTEDQQSVESKPTAPNIAGTSSTPRFIRRLASFGSINYHTPPSKRKARTIDKDEAERLQDNLQRKPSFESTKSVASVRPKLNSLSAIRRKPAHTPTEARARSAMGRKDWEKQKSLGDREHDKDKCSDSRNPTLDQQHTAERESSPTTGDSAIRHGLKDLRGKLEANGFEVRWLRVKGKDGSWWERERRSKGKDNEAQTRNEKENELEQVGWL
ncbi:MAG: hypothetical protein M1820_006306 [Bogoriella megaspora]|nr:MAG: hypothetical protein M1820_006306 [Bogoriella megaspora]